jgi:hypothetical protein
MDKPPYTEDSEGWSKFLTDTLYAGYIEGVMRFYDEEGL